MVAMVWVGNEVLWHTYLFSDQNIRTKILIDVQPASHSLSSLEPEDGPLHSGLLEAIQGSANIMLSSTWIS